jgi:cell wall-associated NlpC family hydrolase
MVFLTGSSAFSQEKYTEHTVSKGETITKIAQQYNIKPSKIYELNPDARKGIKFKSILLIPATTKKSTPEVATQYSEDTHTVLLKETLYGIARQYGVTVKDLYKIDPELEKSGLKPGQVIKIPKAESNQKIQVSVVEPVKDNAKIVSLEKKEAKIVATALPQSKGTTELLNEGIVREVLANETKYAIAKEYGITVGDIDKANPILETEALKIGQKILIPVKEENSVTPVTVKEDVKIEKSVKVAIKEVPKKQTPVLSQPAMEDIRVETEVTHEVLPKETKYGIAKEYGITVKELERQNPKLANKLPIGYKLSIRSQKPIAPTLVKEEVVANEKMEGQGSAYKGKSFLGTDFLDQLVSVASENIGTRYRMGGTSKDGFDCSGLMCTTFGAFDIQLPRTSIEQSQYGIKINTEDAQKGDLIFFKTNGRRQINHVGMVVDVIDGDIKFIHASVSGGVMISSVKEKYYSKRVTQVNRVL